MAFRFSPCQPCCSCTATATYLLWWSAAGCAGVAGQCEVLAAYSLAALNPDGTLQGVSLRDALGNPVAASITSYAPNGSLQMGLQVTAPAGNYLLHFDGGCQQSAPLGGTLLQPIGVQDVPIALVCGASTTTQLFVDEQAGCPSTEWSTPPKADLSVEVDYTTYTLTGFEFAGGSQIPVYSSGAGPTVDFTLTWHGNAYCGLHAGVFEDIWEDIPPSYFGFHYPVSLWKLVTFGGGLVANPPLRTQGLLMYANFEDQATAESYIRVAADCVNPVTIGALPPPQPPQLGDNACLNCLYGTYGVGISVVDYTASPYFLRFVDTTLGGLAIPWLGQPIGTQVNVPTTWTVAEA